MSALEQLAQSVVHLLFLGAASGSEHRSTTPFLVSLWIRRPESVTVSLRRVLSRSSRLAAGMGQRAQPAPTVLDISMSPLITGASATDLMSKSRRARYEYTCDQCGSQNLVGEGGVLGDAAFCDYTLAGAGSALDWKYWDLRRIIGTMPSAL